MALERIGLQAVVEGANAYVRDLRRMREEEQRVAKGARNAETATGKAFGRERMRSIGSSMTKAGGIMSASLTAPIAGIGFTALSAAADFEAGMNQVQAVSGATASQMEGMSGMAKELGRTTRFSAGEATEGMNFLAMAGFEVDEVMGALPGTLELATAANMDLGRAADIVSNTLTGYGMEAAEVGRVNDVFAKSMTSANVTIGMMGESMKFVAPVAASAGIEFEEASAAIAKLGDAGIQGSMAGTTLRGAISRLLSPTGKAKDVIADLGLQVRDSTGQMLPLNDIIRQLEESGADTAQMMELFGLRAGPGMSALVSQGADSLGELTQELRTSGGTAKELADVQMQGLKGALRELKSAWEGFGIAIAEAGLLDWATDVIRSVTDVVSNLAEANPEILKLGTVIGGLIAATGPVLVALGSMSLIIGSISGPVLALTAAVAGLALIFSTLVVDAEKLPDPLQRIVGPAQAIAESMPAVAAGVGAVIAAMVFQKVASFATAMSGLVDQMIAARGVAGTMKLGFGRALSAAFMTPVGAISAVSLAMVGVDQVLRGLTGEGLIGNLTRLFQGVDHAARGAEEGLDRFTASMTRMGDAADPLKVGTDEVKTAIEGLDRDLSTIARKDYWGEGGQIIPQRESLEEAAGEIGAVIEAMRENDVAASELVDTVNELSDETLPGQADSLRDLVKEQVEWEAIQNELVGEINNTASEVENFTGLSKLLADESLNVSDKLSIFGTGIRAIGENSELAKEPMESYRDVLLDAGLSAEEAEAEMAKYRDTQEDVTEETEEAKSPLDEYTEGMKDAKDKAGDLDDALSDLVSRFGEMNPTVIANNAEIARLEIQKAKLVDKDRDLTEAEEDQLEALENQIDGLKRQNDVFTTTADAYNPIIENTKALTGATDDQAFSFGNAMLKYVEDGEKGVGILTDINEALASTDPETAIQALGDIRESMNESIGPAATEEIFRELGPVIGGAFEDASPEVIEMAKALGIPIPGAIQEGIDEEAEEKLHPVEMMRQTYGSRETQETWQRTGIDTGHQYVAGLESGVEEKSGEVDAEKPINDTYGSKRATDAAATKGKETGWQYMAGIEAGVDASDKQATATEAVEQAIKDVTGDDDGVSDAQGAIIGRGVLSGMETGLGDQSARQRVIDKASELADLITSPVKELLGIESPSEVMRQEVGIASAEGLAIGLDEGGSLVEDAANRLAEKLRTSLVEEMQTVGSLYGQEAETMLADVAALISVTPMDEPMRDSARKMLEGWREEVNAGMPINEREIITLLEQMGFAVQDGIKDVAEDTAGAIDDWVGSLALGTVSDFINNARGVGREGARNIVDDFLGTIEETRIEDELRDQFGDLGGSVAVAIGDALADPEGRGGATLATAVQRLIEKAREEGVEGIDALGDDLISTLAEALKTGKDETVQAALDILGEITKGIEDESENISTALGDGFEEGMKTAEEVLKGWRDRLQESLEEGTEMTKGNAEEMLDNLDDVLEKTDVPAEFRRWAKGLIDDMGEEIESGGHLVEEEVLRLIERIGAAASMAEGECTGMCDAADECSCGGVGGASDGGQAPSDRPSLGRPPGGGLIAPAFPSFDIGTWSVPEDMLAQVHAGEMIVPAGAADLFREIMAPMPGDVGGDTRIENNMSPTFVAQGQTEEEMRQNLHNAVDDFMRQRREGSIRSGSVLTSTIG